MEIRGFSTQPMTRMYQGPTAVLYVSRNRPSNFPRLATLPSDFRYGGVAALAVHGSRFKTCCEFSCFPETGSKYLTFFHPVEGLDASRSKSALIFADLYNNDHRSGALGCKLAGVMESRSGLPHRWTNCAAASSVGVGNGVALTPVSLLAVKATQ